MSVEFGPVTGRNERTMACVFAIMFEVSGLYVYRGTMCLGVRKLSSCRILIETTCGKRPMSERSGDWGAGLSPGVGVDLKAGSHAKTIAKTH